MKSQLSLLALFLGFAALANAQDLQRSVDFKIIYALTTGDPPLNANPLTEPGNLGRLDLKLNTTFFPTDEPPSAPYTSSYLVPGGWEIGLSGEEASWFTGVVNSATVTDNHPAWDALAFAADTNTGEAQSSGETLVGAAGLVLSDPSRTALSSTALVPMPAFSAFASGEVALGFFTMPDEERAFKGSQTLAIGRVTSIDENPDTPVYRCEGFARPAQRTNMLNSLHRRLQLSARLADTDGNAADMTNLLSRPIIRVLRLPDATYVTSLAADDATFIYRGGRWIYTLRSEALPGPGNYLVYLTTPDSDEYVIDQLCAVQVKVK